MSKQTESESKAIKIIRDLFSSTLEEQPQLRSMLEHVSLTPFTFTGDIPKIIIVSIPFELLQNIRLKYSKFISALKKEFPNFMILTRRSSETLPKKNNNVSKDREQFISDLLFPAIVQGRSAEVISKTDYKQSVFLDSKTQCWTDIELLAIEKVFDSLFGEKYRVENFGSAY